MSLNVKILDAVLNLFAVLQGSRGLKSVNDGVDRVSTWSLDACHFGRRRRPVVESPHVVQRLSHCHVASFQEGTETCTEGDQISAKTAASPPLHEKDVHEAQLNEEEAPRVMHLRITPPTCTRGLANSAIFYEKMERFGKSM